MKQDFAAFFIQGGRVYQNPKILGDWFLEEAETSNVIPTRDVNEQWFQLVERAAHKVLNASSEINMIPDHVDWVSGAWLDNK